MKKLESRPPFLLYFADFPPSNLNGGSILISRLLGDYPVDKLIILTGLSYTRQSPQQGRLRCHHIIFPTINNTGRWGLGRIKGGINYLLIPFLIIFGIWIVSRRRIQIIFTVAHGNFFIAATFVSYITKIPLVTKVDDDWASFTKYNSFILKYFCEDIFYFALKHSHHVYAINSFMQEMLKVKFGINSTLQSPAIEALPKSIEEPEEKFMDGGILHIVYTGNTNGLMFDSLSVLINLLLRHQKYGLAQWQLQIYSNLSKEQIERWGWIDDNRIKIHKPVSEYEHKNILSCADILFLPFSFSPSQRQFIITSFPSKIAAYLASGRPIIVFAPSYSTITCYAKMYGFAEIVDEPKEEKLAAGIKNIVSSKVYRQQLSKNAMATFRLNHDIIKERKNFKDTISALVTCKNIQLT